jgi:hypothetical protein
MWHKFGDGSAAFDTGEIVNIALAWIEGHTYQQHIVHPGTIVSKEVREKASWFLHYSRHRRKKRKSNNLTSGRWDSLP